MTTIFDNYCSSEREEEARKFLLEEYPENGEPTDEAVWDEVRFQEEINWEDVEAELTAFIDRHGDWLVKGYFGGWRGNQAGGKIISSFSELSGCWEGCDYIEFTDVNGHFYIKCSHHDGTNSYELKRLTQKGSEYAENHYYESDREVHEKIFNSNFLSALPHFAKEVWGCKESA